MILGEAAAEDRLQLDPKKAVNWWAMLIFLDEIFHIVAWLGQFRTGRSDGQDIVEVGDDRKDCCGAF
jgi:hypothetical protein